MFSTRQRVQLLPLSLAGVGKEPTKVNKQGRQTWRLQFLPKKWKTGVCLASKS